MPSIITKILWWIFVILLFIGALFTADTVIDKIKANEQAIQEMRQSLESHNQRLNQLEQPELVEK
ncbi:unnamed protein product [marine sediment metagenome]|uniref:Uncharacterized protein n=1 Tax=marine sediment metagenome TaxID=412755 RepID=X1B559_9ZZZZ